MKVSVKQDIDVSQSKLTSSIRMHCVGSELFKIKPVYEIKGNSLTGNIRHYAYLPWPLTSIAEEFMVRQSSKQISLLKQVLTDENILLKSD